MLPSPVFIGHTSPWHHAPYSTPQSQPSHSAKHGLTTFQAPYWTHQQQKTRGQASHLTSPSHLALRLWRFVSSGSQSALRRSVWGAESLRGRGVDIWSFVRHASILEGTQKTVFPWGDGSRGLLCYCMYRLSNFWRCWSFLCNCWAESRCGVGKLFIMNILRSPDPTVYARGWTVSTCKVSASISELNSASSGNGNGNGMISLIWNICSRGRTSIVLPAI